MIPIHFYSTVSNPTLIFANVRYEYLTQVITVSCINLYKYMLLVPNFIFCVGGRYPVIYNILYLHA